MEAALWLLHAGIGSCGPRLGPCPGNSGFLSWSWRPTQCNFSDWSSCPGQQAGGSPCWTECPGAQGGGPHPAVRRSLGNSRSVTETRSKGPFNFTSKPQCFWLGKGVGGGWGKIRKGSSSSSTTGQLPPLPGSKQRKWETQTGTGTER